MENKGYEFTEDGVEVRPNTNKYASYASMVGTPRPLNEGTPLNSKVELKKSIGFVSSVGIIVGVIIGSGIFISPKGVLRNSGSVGLSLVVWLLCGVFSLLGCLAFAELGTLIPDTGGEYIYLLEAFAPDRKTKVSWWRPLFAFLQSWVFFFIKPTGLAIQGLTCGEYIVSVVGLGCDNWTNFVSPRAAVKCIAVCLIMIISAVNIYSVKAAARTQNFFSAVKVSALVLIIIGGMVRISQGYTKELAKGFEGSKFEFGSIAGAFYSGLFAYVGWDNLNNITKEMKNPRKDLLPALMTSMSIVIVCYMLVNVSYLTGLTTDELLNSDAVAVSFAGNLMGVTGSVIIIISVACSTFGAGNGAALTHGRIVYTAAREGHMIEVLSYIHMYHFTPAPAIASISIIALLLVIPSNVGVLIRIGGFVDWIFMGMSMVALLTLRYTKKDEFRSIKVPIFVPIVVLLFSIFVVVTPFIEDPSVEYVYSLVFLLLGVCVYFVFVYFRYKLPGLGKYGSGVIQWL